VKEALLGYWVLLIALPYHKSMEELDLLVETFLKREFGVTVDFEVGVCV
jgi:hypothetical protein